VARLEGERERRTHEARATGHQSIPKHRLMMVAWNRDLGMFLGSKRFTASQQAPNTWGMAHGRRGEFRTVSVAVPLDSTCPLGVASGPGEAQ
jgi:hypothetical protein